MNDSVALEPAVASEVINGDEALYEIINGRRTVLPPMSIFAAWIATRLRTYLSSFSDMNRVGRVVTEGLFILDSEKNLRRRPDVAFVSAGRWPLDRRLPAHGDWEVVPDIVVEVASPNDLLEIVLAKVSEYFSYGVRQAWLVIPSQEQIYVYDSPTQVRMLSGADVLDGGEILPGFRLSLATLFQHGTSA